MSLNYYGNRIITVQLDSVLDSESYEIDSNHPNYYYSTELDRVLHNMLMYTPYIGCITCGMPIAYQWEICDEIANSRYSDMIVAYAVPISVFSLMLYTVVLEPALIHWETRVNCSNCRAHLSFTALTIYNTQIAEFAYNGSDACVILDSSAIALYQREYE